MKRKLDLNGPGSVLAGWGCLMLAPVPALLYAIFWLSGRAGLDFSFLLVIGKLSALMGGALLGLLLVLLVIEAIQDRRFQNNYMRTRNRKLPTGDGHYECQLCGCRTALDADNPCPVCGK